MTPSELIALATLAVTVLCVTLAGVVWLVRLEGRVVAVTTAATVEATARKLADEAEATARKLADDAQGATLAAHVTLQDNSRMEIVRLQEQIKHLTDLIERYFIPAGVRPAREAL